MIGVTKIRRFANLIIRKYYPVSGSGLTGSLNSLLSLQAGAAEKGVPLYKHLSDLAGNPKLVNRLALSAIVHAYLETFCARPFIAVVHRLFLMKDIHAISL